MSNFRSRAQGSKYYEQIKIMVDVNDSESWAQGSRRYEQLSAVVDMNDSGLWA